MLDKPLPALPTGSWVPASVYLAPLKTRVTTTREPSDEFDCLPDYDDDDDDDSDTEISRNPYAAFGQKCIKGNAFSMPNIKKSCSNLKALASKSKLNSLFITFCLSVFSFFLYQASPKPSPPNLTHHNHPQAPGSSAVVVAPRSPVHHHRHPFPRSPSIFTARCPATTSQPCHPSPNSGVHVLHGLPRLPIPAPRAAQCPFPVHSP
jgi:hypothetical protein